MGRSDFHIEIGIAHGVANLIISTTGSKHRKRSRKSNIARKRKTSCYANHILFGNAYIKEAIFIFRTRLCKLFCGG